jgi:hypothetical protein
MGRDRVVALLTPSQMCSARRPREDLPRHEEWDQDIGDLLELAVAGHQIVLVASVGVPGGIGVVLEQVDVAGDAFLVESPLGRTQETFEDPLPRLVVGDQLLQVIALGRRVLGVAAHIQIQPRAVLEEDIAAASPADDPSEEVSRDLVRG